MNSIDAFLNKLTMYRLLVYGLAGLIGVAIVFTFLGRLSFTPTDLVISLLLILTASYLTDRGLGRLLHVPTNMESSLITALILVLILQPASSVSAGIALVVAGAVSSASKFLISWHGKHIFNPAAFAAALVALTGLATTSWWIGSSVFWPFTLLFGLAVVRKIRRFPLVFTFVVTAVVLQLAQFVVMHQSVHANMKHALIASPLIFLATIMLTEPATMPWRRNLQLVFGGIVAVLYVFAWQIGPLIIYPEVALLLGNIFAFIVSPKLRVRLHLKEKRQISDRVYDYVFQPERWFNFLPGQYMEWTLANVPYDSRGNRRTFTIASSPTEADVHLGVKFYEPASMYKAAFEQMVPGDTVYASQLAGNFTLKGNEGKKLAFIAGGIGITPFRSMIKYLTDTDAQVDLTLLYVVSDPQEFAYVEEFRQATSLGVRTIPIVTDINSQSPSYITSKVTPELIARAVPDYAYRTFYISGPNGMVDSVKHELRTMKVPRTHIKTDHFSGY